MTITLFILLQELIAFVLQRAWLFTFLYSRGSNKSFADCTNRSISIRLNSNLHSLDILQKILKDKK